MKRRILRLLLLLAAVLVAAGWLANGYAGRRAEARDRELAELLAGPLLPGVPVAGETCWIVELAGADIKPIAIRGVPRDTLGADLVRQTMPPMPDPFPSFSTWLVGAGTPTASRLFERLQTDPDVQEARKESSASSVFRGATLVVNGTVEDLDGGTSITPLKSDGTGLRERLLSALDAESAREDVAFAEERLTAGASIILNNLSHDEKPGRFRRAVGWCCKQLDFLPLDSLADWASENRRRPSDPVFPFGFQALSLRVEEGRTPLCRMHQGGDEYLRQFGLAVDASAPLAASLQALVAKHRPETLGRPHPNAAEEPSLQSAQIWIVFPDRIEARTVPLADARLRAFLLDFLRLLADPQLPPK